MINRYNRLQVESAFLAIGGQVRSAHCSKQVCRMRLAIFLLAPQLPLVGITVAHMTALQVRIAARAQAWDKDRVVEGKTLWWLTPTTSISRSPIGTSSAAASPSSADQRRSSSWPRAPQPYTYTRWTWVRWTVI